MAENKLIKLKDHASIIAHIEMMQGIISRLADNSAKCKDWCFAFVGALIIFLVSGDNLSGKWMFLIAYAIVFMFYILDCYYLGLERKVRDNYEEFIKSINESELTEDTEDDVEAEQENPVTNETPSTVNHLSISIFLPNLVFTEPKKCKFSGKVLKGIPYGMASLSTFIPYSILIVLIVILNIFYQGNTSVCQCCG